MLNETSLMIAAVFTEDIVAGVILAIAAYWAFTIRTVLKNKSSRSQALWLGVACVFLIPLLPTPTSTDPRIELVTGLFFVAALPLILLAWIDGTVRTARRSDPLFRDTIGWSKVRIIVWGATLALIVSYFILVTIETLTGAVVTTIVGLLIATPYFPVVLAGTPALLLSARRTGSVTRRKNLKWFGLFALFLLAAILTYFTMVPGFVGQSIPNGILYFLAFRGIYAIGYNIFQILFIVATYCLYRNARSLAMLNRVSGSED